MSSEARRPAYPWKLQTSQCVQHAYTHRTSTRMYSPCQTMLYFYTHFFPDVQRSLQKKRSIIKTLLFKYWLFSKQIWGSMQKHIYGNREKKTRKSVKEHGEEKRWKRRVRFSHKMWARRSWTLVRGGLRISCWASWQPVQSRKCDQLHQCLSNFLFFKSKHVALISAAYVLKVD